MSDQTDFERITRNLPNHTGEAWSPEKVKADFHLFSHDKRAAALDVIDDHMRTQQPEGESSLREFARLSRLRRDLAATHSTLRKAGR
jgi:hypothetical protein